MIEIVFSRSAGGSLKLAQRLGEGIIGGADGPAAVPAQEETSDPEQKQVEERIRESHRRAWKEAKPMGGREEDVYILPLGLSVGDISEAVPGKGRLEALERLTGSPEAAQDCLTEGLRSLRAVLERISQGEEVRVWFSQEPDEMSGLYWLLNQFGALEGELGAVHVVRMPPFEQGTEAGGGARVNRVIQRSGWGDVVPDEWSRFADLTRTVSPLLIRVAGRRWDQLREENAPLRAVLNGCLVSVPADIYDSFIEAELEAMDEEFDEAILVANVLRRGLGLGDMQIAERIEKMMADGALESVSEPASAEEPYRRRLRKKRRS